MASKQERAAGIVQSWIGMNGNSDMKQISDDIVGILSICHDYLTPEWKKAPSWTADELADAIAEYVIEAYITPTKFSDPMPNPSENPSGNPSGEGSDDAAPELDIPNQH